MLSFVPWRSKTKKILRWWDSSSLIISNRRKTTRKEPMSPVGLDRMRRWGFGREERNLELDGLSRLTNKRVKAPPRLIEWSWSILITYSKHWPRFWNITVVIRSKICACDFIVAYVSLSWTSEILHKLHIESLHSMNATIPWMPSIGRNIRISSTNDANVCGTLSCPVFKNISRSTLVRI